MKTSRVKNSFFNGLSNLILNISVSIISFFMRTIFIKYLGEQCLGLDGLFTNILSLLSLAELGFSTSISFNLYKPLANSDYNQISQLMTYFKRIYRKIGILILALGLLLLPFLNIMAKGYTVNYNIYLIFILYLINTVASYYISYISILIEADQKNYKLTGIRFTSNIITYGLQFVSIIIFKNFILYLLIQFIFRMIERYIIYLYIRKKYPNVDLNCKQQLNTDSQREIKKNIKGILFHKVGNYAVNGTDNILISSIINISTTGIYYNYNSITSIFHNLVAAVINASSASFGNLNVTETPEVKENVFNLMNFLCLLFAGTIFVVIYFCIGPFIVMWFGENFFLNSTCILIICVNMYLSCLMQPINTVKNSSGIYYIDRYVPLIQAAINLIVSIILGIKIGLLGILLGTCVSCLLTVNWTKPYIIYKYVFQNRSIKYFKQVLKNILTIIISIVLTYMIINQFEIKNAWINLISNGFISVIIYLFIFITTNYRSKELKFFIEFTKK